MPNNKNNIPSFNLKKHLLRKNGDNTFFVKTEMFLINDFFAYNRVPTKYKLIFCLQTFARWGVY